MFLPEKRQAGQATCSVHHVQKTHLAMSLSSSQLGGPPCSASPLAFGLIGFYSLFYSIRSEKIIILCFRVEVNAKGTAGTVTAFRKDASLLVNSSHHESG